MDFHIIAVQIVLPKAKKCRQLFRDLFRRNWNYWCASRGARTIGVYRLVLTESRKGWRISICLEGNQRKKRIIGRNWRWSWTFWILNNLWDFIDLRSKHFNDLFLMPNIYFCAQFDKIPSVIYQFHSAKFLLIYLIITFLLQFGFTILL